MAHYFFNIEGGSYPEPDEGTDLKWLEQARAEAVTMAGEMLKDANGRCWGASEWRLHVTDEAGTTVCQLIIRGET